MQRCRNCQGWERTVEAIALGVLDEDARLWRVPQDVRKVAVCGLAMPKVVGLALRMSRITLSVQSMDR
jgi:hypothetical protein